MDLIKEAIVHGNEQAVKKWISAHKNGLQMMDEDGSTALHYACTENQLEIAEILLKKNASPNVKDTAGWTPFHSAASSRHYKICKILLKYDGDPSIKNNSNSSPFAYLGRATTTDKDIQIEVLKTCLDKKKVDIHTRNDLGETILHMACLRGSVEVIECLIEKSSDVNAVNIRGENALHYAVRSGHPEFVTLLLDNKINPNQKSTEDKTPLDVAIEFNIVKVSSVLEEYHRAHPVQLPWDSVSFEGKMPTKRSFHRIALVGNQMFVYGGGVSAVQYSNQLHEFSFGDPPTWKNTLASSGEKPPELAGHSLTVVEQKLYLFGGRNAIQTSSDLLMLDCASMDWKLVRKLKEPRCYHTATMLPDGITLMIFGGSSNKGRNDFLNSVDLVNVKNGNVKTIEGTAESPCPRMNHGATLIDKKVFVYGGKDDATSFDDLFAYDIDSNTWSGPLSCSGDIPPARFAHCFNALGNTIYMFGGADAKKKAKNCLYSLSIDTLTWTNLTIEQVPALSGHDSFQLDGKLYYLGWDDQIQFLVFDETNLDAVKPNTKPWVPDGPIAKKEKTKLTADDLQLKSGHSRDSSVDDTRRRSGYKQVNKKAVMERIEKLEFFSNSLTSNVVDLIALVESELAKEEPFTGKSADDIQLSCAAIQEFCISERPPKSWTGSNSKKKDHFHTLVPEKAPFPMHHYEALPIPPKRVTPTSLEKQENATEEETLLRNRNLVLNEIISTETDYVRDLGVLIGLYLKPLKEEYKEILGPYEVKKLFKNAEVLWDIHLKILRLLQEEEEKPVQEQQIGNIFSQMKGALGEYNTYCANQQTSSETAEELLKQNSKFREFVEEVQQLEPCHRQEFYSFLLKPFQRICRYSLLLKELMKQTPSDWKDYQVLEQAMNDIGDVVQTANETKRVNDKISAMLEISAQLVVPPEHPELNHLHKFSFVFQHSGLIEVDPKKGKTKKGSIHLFTTMLLATLPKGDKLLVFQKFNLAKTYVAIPAVTTKAIKFPAEFTCGDSAIIFGASSEEARNELMKYFKDAKRNL